MKKFKKKFTDQELSLLPPPKLDCPNCGVGLIPPHGRGRHDEDGDYIEHRDGCRCRWCEWVWLDDVEPVACECGARVRVHVDDDHAYARDVAHSVRWEGVFRGTDEDPRETGWCITCSREVYDGESEQHRRQRT